MDKASLTPNPSIATRTTASFPSPTTEEPITRTAALNLFTSVAPHPFPETLLNSTPIAQTSTTDSSARPLASASADLPATGSSPAALIHAALIRFTCVECDQKLVDTDRLLDYCRSLGYVLSSDAGSPDIRISGARLRLRKGRERTRWRDVRVRRIRGR
jgi:hypothetical protein